MQLVLGNPIKNIYGEGASNFTIYVICSRITQK